MGEDGPQVHASTIPACLKRDLGLFLTARLERAAEAGGWNFARFSYFSSKICSFPSKMGHKTHSLTFIMRPAAHCGGKGTKISIGKNFTHFERIFSTPMTACLKRNTSFSATLIYFISFIYYIDQSTCFNSSSIYKPHQYNQQNPNHEDQEEQEVSSKGQQRRRRCGKGVSSKIQQE